MTLMGKAFLSSNMIMHFRILGLRTWFMDANSPCC